jgi:hypothetical protein
MSVKYPTVAEAKRILHFPELLYTGEQVLAAHALMQACAHDPEVTLDDMLRCLDYGGTIATVGARCLYIRTGRDGVGSTDSPPKGKPYVTDRADWEAYLRKRFPESTTR